MHGHAAESANVRPDERMLLLVQPTCWWTTRSRWRSVEPPHQRQTLTVSALDHLAELHPKLTESLTSRPLWTVDMVADGAPLGTTSVAGTPRD